MEIIKIKDFDNISQRVLWGFNFIYSEFAPIQSDMVSIESQKSLHKMMSRMIDSLYENPSLLELPTDKDQSYEWYVCNNQIPELDKTFQDIFKKLNSFYRFLYTTALYGTITVDSLQVQKSLLKDQKINYKPCYSKFLNDFGIIVTSEKDAISLKSNDNSEMFKALKLLANTTNAGAPQSDRFVYMSAQYSLFNFSRCSFDGKTEYLLDRIDRLYDFNGLLRNLKDECLKRKYRAQMHLDFGPTNFSFSLEFRNTIGGFLIVYSPRKYQKFGFGTLNGIGEKAMLEDFTKIDRDMQEHLLSICRPCSNCLGCTKGGKSKVYTVNVEFDGKPFQLCPQFPQHSWADFDCKMIDILFKYHDLQEVYAAK
ncbi:MAG: hypothetical protein ACYCYI_09490 [Saccharofermentanales bacterium]